MSNETEEKSGPGVVGTGVAGAAGVAGGLTALGMLTKKGVVDNLLATDKLTRDALDKGSAQFIEMVGKSKTPKFKGKAAEEIIEFMAKSTEWLTPKTSGMAADASDAVKKTAELVKKSDSIIGKAIGAFNAVADGKTKSAALEFSEATHKALLDKVKPLAEQLGKAEGAAAVAIEKQIAEAFAAAGKELHTGYAKGAMKHLGYIDRLKTLSAELPLTGGQKGLAIAGGLGAAAAIGALVYTGAKWMSGPSQEQGQAI